MKKMWAVIKSNPEVTGYVMLATLITGACFLPELLWVVAVYALLFAFFLRNEFKIAGLILFLYNFCSVLKYPTIIFVFNFKYLSFSLFDFLVVTLQIFIILIYTLRLFHKEKKINFKILTPIVLFLIYCLLPVHNVDWNDLIMLLIPCLSIYVIFETRDKINFVNIVRVLLIAIILSCMLSLCYEFSEFINSCLQFHHSESGVVRFQGLTSHSMHLAALAMLGICSLLFIKVNQKIKNMEFYLYFIMVFTFGYLSISRAYMITVGFAVGLFSLFYFMRYKSKSLKSIITIIGIIALVSLIFLDVTKTYFIRFNTYYESWVPANENELKDLLTGKIEVNLIRSDLYKYYLMDWSSSLKTIFFGRGISSPLIGGPGMNAHNIFLQMLWEHGITGYIFLIIIFCSVINWKEIKNWKMYLPVLILLIPFFLFISVEVIFFTYTGMILIISLIIWSRNSLLQEKLSLNNCNVKKTLGEKCDYKTKISVSARVKLSLIIPVYNGENYIKKCIDKVLKIKLNKEIIVINDGSIDNTFELLKEYGEKIILINLKENQGVSHARNLGLDRASGDFVAFMDVDDDFELEMYEKIILRMIEKDADIGICRYDHKHANGKVIKTDFFLNYDNLSQAEVIKLYLTHKLMHAVWSSVYKINIVKNIKFEENFAMAEDKLYQLRALLKAKKTCFVNEILYHYIKNFSSSTHILSSPEKVLGHVKINEYLSQDEKVILNQFSTEYDTFILRGTDTAVNIISRWANQDKTNKKEAKEFIKKIANKEICGKFIKNKNLPISTRFEFFILKFFGVSFHLFLFSFYKFLRTTYLKIFRRG